MINTIMRFFKFILTSAICTTALFGDYIVFKSKYSESQLQRAFLDNTVHAIIGLLSSLLFFSHDINVASYAILCNVIFCTVLSSFIDIDHVFVAKSFYLKDMTNLKQRGIFHCTTFFFLISTSLLIYSHITKKLNLYILNWMIIIAYTSHHIRDGNRRGLWLYPFGETPPLNKYVYVFLLATLPYVYVYLYRLFEPVFRHTVIEHTYKMLI